MNNRNELTNPQFIKDLFRHYQLKPKDYMGQNFLVDEIALDSIVTAGELKNTDTVLEVGPGLGILTQALAERAGKVIAVEKDRTLLEILDVNLKAYNNIKIYNQDILRFNVTEVIKGPYKVVANIPYYLTSHLFKYFLTQKNRPSLIVVLIQKEVGLRIAAKPGSMSILAISVQLFATPEIIEHVPKESFWPTPKVDSAILKLTPHQKYSNSLTDEKAFFRIVKVAFAAKRKQLHNNLATGLKMPSAAVHQWLELNKIDPKSRAEDLSIENWISLHKTMPQ